jgi:hypothetical protein
MELALTFFFQARILNLVEISLRWLVGPAMDSHGEIVSKIYTAKGSDFASALLRKSHGHPSIWALRINQDTT